MGNIRQELDELNKSLEIQEVTLTTSNTFNGICTLKNDVIKLSGTFIINLNSGWNQNVLKIPYPPMKTLNFPLTGYGNSTIYAAVGQIKTNGEISLYASTQGITEVHFNLVYDI